MDSDSDRVEDHVHEERIESGNSISSHKMEAEFSMVNDTNSPEAESMNETQENTQDYPIMNAVMSKEKVLGTEDSLENVSIVDDASCREAKPAGLDEDFEKSVDTEKIDAEKVDADADNENADEKDHVDEDTKKEDEGFTDSYPDEYSEKPDENPVKEDTEKQVVDPINEDAEEQVEGSFDDDTNKPDSEKLAENQVDDASCREAKPAELDENLEKSVDTEKVNAEKVDADADNENADEGTKKEDDSYPDEDYKKPDSVKQVVDPVNEDAEEQVDSFDDDTNKPDREKLAENQLDKDIEEQNERSPRLSFSYERSTSIKENPFKLAKAVDDEPDQDITQKKPDSMSDDNIPFDEMSVTKPAEKPEVKSSPMVVSVGTIEVNGSDQYEDINIMSKGQKAESVSTEATPEVTTSAKDTADNFESLRDLRFSSISIYDKPRFEEDIIITVEDAQKHAAESFVSYKVVTRTTREAFLQHEFHVRRRYQDFFWLSNILNQQYHAQIIPPLPQKKMFNKFDPNFLRLRQLALNKFLCRIAEHPILSSSEHFFTFLSAKQVELIEQKKTVLVKRFNIPQIPISNVVSPFTATSEYLDEFGKILSSLSTISNKLDKEQAEQFGVMATLPPCLALWANSEVPFSNINF